MNNYIIRKWHFLFLMLVWIPCYSCNSIDSRGGEKEMDIIPNYLMDYPDDKPDKPLHLLFIHHSCGGQLLADIGEPDGVNNIFSYHPNGGGLRKLLQQNNYIVHEASHNSSIGDKTDICHWNEKFKDHMDKVLKCNNQDEYFKDDTVNQIVVFKSCYPNSWIISEGTYPGEPNSCEKNLENYKAAYNSLIQYFRARPHTLFVVFTAPPLAKPKLYKRGTILEMYKHLTGKPDTLYKIGKRARAFNNWLKDKEYGWLKKYDMNNIVVFDYYDILTDFGESNWSMYPTGNKDNSHPSSIGNTKAAKWFVPFLNRAVNRMGL